MNSSLFFTRKKYAESVDTILHMSINRNNEISLPVDRVIFDESLNLTNGGPGKSTMTMSHYIYNMSFVQSPNFGYAAAMSILILIMVAILALIQMKVGDER